MVLPSAGLMELLMADHLAILLVDLMVRLLAETRALLLAGN